MANLKIIWTTGSPFSPGCINKIAYETSPGKWNVYREGSWTSQTTYSGDSYRPATAEEIAEHWQALHPMWTPEPGDKVIVTQSLGVWHNKRGTIIENDGDDYWVVRRDDDGQTYNFMKGTQMILAPYEETAKPVETPKSTSPESKHGFTIGDVVIPDCDNFKGRECIVRALGSASVGVHCPSGAGLGGHTLDGHCPDHTGRWYLPSQLKLVSKEKEPAKPFESIKSMFGFTVGDIVIPECSPFFGEKCIVKGFNVASESVGVYCPSAPASEAGHNLEGRLESGQKGWWHNKNRLKLASKEEPETVSKSSTPSTPSIPLPKEGYVTIRFFTEEEFRSKGLWSVFEGQGYPKGWNINGEMNKYLGTYLQTREPGFTSDKSLGYGGWTFKDTDYEVIHEGVETKPEPKEPEMKPQKFKVGDQVTYKSKSSCDGYKYGGDDHDGYVGTITSYGVYRPEYDCYGIYVTCKEGGNYSMLESEFYEYDGLYLGAVTLGTSAGSDLRIISAGTANTTFLGTVGLQIVQTVPKPKDDLAKYDQAPVTLHKKPKTKLITVNTY